MEIRRYDPGEEAEIWRLFFDTMHQVVARDYTPAQINRWAPPDVDMTDWVIRLSRMNPFVAVDDGQIVGFAELEPSGHIDRFYCHHQRQREGIGTALMEAIQTEAKARGIRRLYAEVSTTAAPFFLAKGFEVTSERRHVVCGAVARQFLMQKTIGT